MYKNQLNNIEYLADAGDLISLHNWSQELK
jgi:hypothetical protein